LAEPGRSAEHSRSPFRKSSSGRDRPSAHTRGAVGADAIVYFHKEQLPLLAVWGTNAPYFLLVGATASKRDLPNADIRFYKTSHFALETHAHDIVPVIHAFLDKNVK